MPKDSILRPLNVREQLKYKLFDAATACFLFLEWVGDYTTECVITLYIVSNCLLHSWDHRCKSGLQESVQYCNIASRVHKQVQHKDSITLFFGHNQWSLLLLSHTLYIMCIVCIFSCFSVCWSSLELSRDAPINRCAFIIYVSLQATFSSVWNWRKTVFPTVVSFSLK